ncbi:hypothetical protein BaRGS_00023241 [Batillaria attramentaria]|uniref:Uncharacterized protein n=1 Tax=Batillaria attramentaria TaxID=370345 RepID=A0ABD0KEK3_9CAEN
MDSKGHGNKRILSVSRESHKRKLMIIHFCAPQAACGGLAVSGNVSGRIPTLPLAPHQQSSVLVAAVTSQLVSSVHNHECEE